MTENTQLESPDQQPLSLPFSSLFDSMREPVTLMTPEGTIIESNKAFSSRFNKLPGECIGIDLYSLLPDALAALRRQKADTIMRTGKPLSWQDEQAGKRLLHTAYPVRSAKKNITHLLIIAQDSTSQKRREHSLEEARLLGNAFTGSIPGTFYMVNRHGMYVDWNSCQRDEIGGCLESECSSIEAITTIHPDDRAKVEASIEQILSTGVEESGAVRVLLHGGPEFRWYLLTGRRIVIAEEPFMIGFGIDITERKQAEKELAESEERFRLLFANSSAIIMLLDPETGNIVDANHAAETFYGWPPNVLQQMHFNQINTLPDEEMRPIVETWRSAGQKSFSLKHRKASGITRSVNVTGELIEIAGRGLIYCIIEDITKRKRFEDLSTFRFNLVRIAETQPTDELLEATLNEAERQTESNIGFCHFVGDGPASSFLQITSACMPQQRGQSAKEKTPHPSLYKAQLWDDVIRDKKALFNNSVNAPEKSHDQPEDHVVIKRILLVPLIIGNTVTAILGVGNKLHDYDVDDLQWVEALAQVAWDIVTRKRAEQSTIQMQEALNQSQKMEIVGQLAGGIAHDFNNMLAVIIGHTEIIMNQISEGNPQRTDLEAIHKAASRSADLTRQLLAFARKQTVIPKVLELNTLVEEILPMLRRVIGEAISIIWKPASHASLVRVDPTQIDQILVNLCINSRDAIASQGTITLETRSIPFDQDKNFADRHPGSGAPDDYLMLSVSDNGSGIDEMHLPHIFEPFFTTKKSGKGTGLGLAMVYGIVKQNEGYIDCESLLNRGTSFKIYLPRFNQKRHQERDSASVPAINTNGKTILVVDDDPAILNVCKIMLKDSGYRVIQADSPSKAVALAEEHSGSINLLLTDVVMPEMNGNELSALLTATNPELKTLFMSGYTSDAMSGNQTRNEQINILQKPFRIRTLTTMVQELLGGND